MSCTLLCHGGEGVPLKVLIVGIQVSINVVEIERGKGKGEREKKEQLERMSVGDIGHCGSRPQVGWNPVAGCPLGCDWEISQCSEEGGHISHRFQIPAGQCIGLPRPCYILFFYVLLLLVIFHFPLLTPASRIHWW